jgi:hypothetical protein
MDDQEKLKNAVILMLKKALEGKECDPDLFQDLDNSELFKICQKHRITALASLALNDPDEKWIKVKNDSIRRTVLFDHERAEIFKAFEENGIWYCPLKGIEIKELYPQYGTRQMSDNDILFDKDKAADVRNIMEAMGYECVLFTNHCHDSYHKKPIFNFEMHKTLFNESDIDCFFDYYSDVKERLLKDDDNGYGYHFSDEDSYIYYIAHNHKHLHSSGSGLRSLVDIYLYDINKQGMDRDYIETELKKLNLFEEEKVLKSLAKKLFDPYEERELNEEEKEIFDFIFSSGVYGNRKNFTINGLNRYKKEGSNYKLKYVYHRLFLPESSLKISFPFFYRHKWARPFLAVYRLMKALFIGRDTLKTELGTIINEGEADDQF